MDQAEIFDQHDRLITINILGRDRKVPANDSILRCLQFLDMESISDRDLCWNGECLNCQVWIRSGEKEKAVIACRTNVEEGMEIVKVSPEMEIS